MRAERREDFRETRVSGNGQVIERSLPHGLDSEPRHKIDDFVKEVLGRTSLVVNEMSKAFERMLHDVVTRLVALKEDDPTLDLRALKFEYVRWTPDGKMIMEFAQSLRDGGQNDGPRARHQVIDEFVESVVGRTVPEEMNEEFKQFMRGMIMQFAVLKKHNASISLGDISFDNVRWHDGKIVMDVARDGRPFGRRDARWD